MKKSGLRGRGGAGFPDGHEMVVHAQRMKIARIISSSTPMNPSPEPARTGIFCVMSRINLLEGALIAGFAMGAHKAYIYIRGEFYNEGSTLWQAVA
jgi:NADH-quinone oxidoreductase subunit F